MRIVLYNGMKPLWKANASFVFYETKVIGGELNSNYLMRNVWVDISSILEQLYHAKWCRLTLQSNVYNKIGIKNVGFLVLLLHLIVIEFHKKNP